MRDAWGQQNAQRTSIAFFEPFSVALRNFRADRYDIPGLPAIHTAVEAATTCPSPKVEIVYSQEREAEINISENGCPVSAVRAA